MCQCDVWLRQRKVRPNAVGQGYRGCIIMLKVWYLTVAARLGATQTTGSTIHGHHTPTRPPPGEVTTRVERNKNFAKLQAGYLFPEVARRRREHQAANPDAKLLSLGIGDTTEPIPPTIVNAMRDAAIGLGTREGYSG